MSKAVILLENPELRVKGTKTAVSLMKQALFTCRWVQGGYHAEGEDSESEEHFSVLCCRIVKKKTKTKKEFLGRNKMKCRKFKATGKRRVKLT